MVLTNNYTAFFFKYCNFPIFNASHKLVHSDKIKYLISFICVCDSTSVYPRSVTLRSRKDGISYTRDNIPASLYHAL